MGNFKFPGARYMWGVYFLMTIVSGFGNSGYYITRNPVISIFRGQVMILNKAFGHQEYIPKCPAVRTSAWDEFKV
jgi:hypothetical protein